MNNNCHCGCNRNFVPVSGNWDFNMDDDCQCQRARRNTRESAENRESDCQCQRCNDEREAECCEQNTYIREMEEEECECRQRTRTVSCGCERETTRSRSNGDEGCSACSRSRNRSRNSNCGCEASVERNARTGCDQDDASACARSRKNRGVGIVSAEMQEIDEVFESESALRAGTLFPELHKPLNGYCPCEGNCATCDQASAFAAWEMRLYLNTHPNDKEALALFRKLCKEAEETNYATAFLEDDCCTTCWNWVKNPWPWEYSCQCGDRA